MAHTKAQKAAAGNRDSRSKRLGVKLYGGQMACVGNIIIRQRGMRVKPGAGTRAGRDFTIYAAAVGRVIFQTRRGEQYVAVASA